MMQRLNDLDYLKLTKLQKFIYRLKLFIFSIPSLFKGLGSKILNLFKNGGKAIGNEFVDVARTFKNGDIKTKLSFFIMGFGSIARGQILRGLLFLIFEIVFIGYMVSSGWYWLGKLTTLGTKGPQEVYNERLDQYVMTYYDNSFKILLYGILTIIFIIAFIYTWRVNIKQNKISEQILASGKPLKSSKDDLKSLVDDQFHKTLLALPLTGIIVFTALPILFMILIAFTNFDANHNGYSNALFTWVGNSNFNQLITWTSGSSNFSATFGEILTWTLMWAFFATFTNYFLGIFVALMINKKGIKFKKLWRTILVMTIAIPQFISLLYVSKMFSSNGIVNGWLMDWGVIGLESRIQFWDDPTLARIMVILINIWIGIPYLMLIATGILMNIPQDLYESAKIDGANTFQQFTKITMPYMLFITGPYLLTSFIGNINNFNVIFLLTGGGPTNQAFTTSGGSAGYTDLLITWLFKITTVDSNYKLAAVIGIAVFLVSATISLVVYNILPSMRNEEEFQ